MTLNYGGLICRFLGAQDGVDCGPPYMIHDHRDPLPLLIRSVINRELTHIQSIFQAIGATAYTNKLSKIHYN